MGRDGGYSVRSTRSGSEFPDSTARLWWSFVQRNALLSDWNQNPVRLVGCPACNMLDEFCKDPDPRGTVRKSFAEIIFLMIPGLSYLTRC